MFIETCFNILNLFLYVDCSLLCLVSLVQYVEFVFICINHSFYAELWLCLVIVSLLRVVHFNLFLA